MKRLKTLWDAKYPDINITAKHLNEQAKRIIKKQLLCTGEVQETEPENEKVQILHNLNLSLKGTLPGSQRLQENRIQTFMLRIRTKLKPEANQFI